MKGRIKTKIPFPLNKYCFRTLRIHCGVSFNFMPEYESGKLKANECGGFDDKRLSVIPVFGEFLFGCLSWIGDAPYRLSVRHIGRCFVSHLGNKSFPPGKQFETAFFMQLSGAVASRFTERKRSEATFLRPPASNVSLFSRRVLTSRQT